MATIKISELKDISEGTTPDLVNTKDLANLHESETRSIHGGDCNYAGKSYGAGVTIRRDHQILYCEDRPWYKGGDRWKVVGSY